MEEEPVLSGAFVGDGDYVGNGGLKLQKLWEVAQWKMIKNCPGRYIVRRRKNQVKGVNITSLNLQEFLELVEIPLETESIHVLKSEKCVDPVQIVRFLDGGGVITYCKKNEQDEDVYVHTLNTASGLQRKLEGLRLAFGPIITL